MTVFDDAGALRAAIDRDVEISELREYASALVESVEQLIDGTQTERIGKLITDENGLPPTRAALAIVAHALMAADAVDEQWGNRNMPGAPSITDYGIATVKRLRAHCIPDGVIA